MYLPQQELLEIPRGVLVWGGGGRILKTDIFRGDEGGGWEGAFEKPKPKLLEQYNCK